jgi:predicted nucleotidyltransferase component of viral defense system
MKINKDSLSARIANLTKEKGIPAGIAYSRFFFDEFLCRLSTSPYRDKFVLKGGALLSSVFGIKERVTVDLDFLLTQQSLELGALTKILIEITKDPGHNDLVTFRLIKSEEIRPDDVYGGYSFSLIGQLENVRVPFSIDVVTGDPVTPEVRNYDYQCLLNDETITLKAYPLETIVAEKFETVIEKGVGNSRLKDFYDLLCLSVPFGSQKSDLMLKEAYKETCQHRNFLINQREAIKTIDQIEVNDYLQQRWHAYARKNKYASSITWQSVVMCLRNWAIRLY